jgi:hypothetical protein
MAMRDPFKKPQATAKALTEAWLGSRLARLVTTNRYTE